MNQFFMVLRYGPTTLLQKLKPKLSLSKEIELITRKIYIKKMSMLTFLGILF